MSSAKTGFFLSLAAFLSFAALAQESAPSQGPAQSPNGGLVLQGTDGRRFEGTGGQITAISGDTIKLKTPNGHEATVKTTHDTQFRRDRQPAKLQDFKVGDMVMVRGSSTGQDQWTAQMVVTRSDAQQQFRGELGKQFVVGEVKGLDPPKLTVLRPDGVTQTIEADENTSLKKQGESITMADIQPGDRVFARGEMKNGVFVPAVIMVGTAEQMQFLRGVMGEQGGKGRQPGKEAPPKTNENPK